jgi:hypothetical protein
MPTLYNAKTDEVIGSLTDAQVQTLVNQLEEESLKDQDYAIDSMTLAYFDGLGIDPDLLSLLRAALGSQSEVIVRWAD